MQMFIDVCYIALSLFVTDTAMHPVLKNLGITDKVIYFITESVNGNKVRANRFGRAINRRSLNEFLFKTLKKKAKLINGARCASIFLHELV